MGHFRAHNAGHVHIGLRYAQPPAHEGAPAFELSTPMLVMPFLSFRAQGRICKSTKAWREEALQKQWLVVYDESSGMVVIFVSHTCAAPSHRHRYSPHPPGTSLDPPTSVLSLALSPLARRSYRPERSPAAPLPRSVQVVGPRLYGRDQRPEGRVR